MENEKKKTPGASNRRETYLTMRRLESKAQVNRDNKAAISDLKKKASVSNKPSMNPLGRLKEVSAAKRDLSYIAGQGGKLANLSAGEQRTYMRGSRAESAQSAPAAGKKNALRKAVADLKARSQPEPSDKAKKK